MSTSNSTIQPKQASSSKKKNTSDKNSNLFTNLLLLVAIGLVLFATQTIKQELTKTQQILEKQATAKLNQQPVRPSPSSTKKKNVLCPNAKQDLEKCYEKQAKCQKTQQQFQAAQKQFSKLIADCARSNEQNQKMNEQMQTQVLQMEKDIGEAEKLM